MPPEAIAMWHHGGDRRAYGKSRPLELIELYHSEEGEIRT
jgi:hypothetical protein